MAVAPAKEAGAASAAEHSKPASAAADYDIDITTGDPQLSTVVCAQQALAMIADGIIKDVSLTSKVRTPCIP